MFGKLNREKVDLKSFEVKRQKYFESIFRASKFNECLGSSKSIELI